MMLTTFHQYPAWRQPDLLPQRNDRLAWSDFGRSLNTQWSMIGHRIQTAVANYIVYTSKKTASQQKLSIIVQAQENPCGSTPMGGECSASALLEMTEMLRNVLGFNLSSTGRGLKEQVKIIREVAGWWLRQKQGEYIGPNLGGF